MTEQDWNIIDISNCSDESSSESFDFNVKEETIPLIQIEHIANNQENKPLLDIETKNSDISNNSDEKKCEKYEVYDNSTIVNRKPSRKRLRKVNYTIKGSGFINKRRKIHQINGDNVKCTDYNQIRSRFLNRRCRRHLFPWFFILLFILLLFSILIYVVIDNVSTYSIYRLNSINNTIPYKKWVYCKYLINQKVTLPNYCNTLTN